VCPASVVGKTDVENYISGLHFESAYADGFFYIEYKNSAVTGFSRERMSGDTPAYSLLHLIRHNYLDMDLWEKVDVDITPAISE